MTSRLIFEATLIELNKNQAPPLKLYEFNYLFNKAINLYINKVYNLYEINQQTTDDIRVLKSSASLEPTQLVDKHKSQSTFSQIHLLNGATYEVYFPLDYLHILNCTCVYEMLKQKDCWDEGSYVEVPAIKLNSDAWPMIMDNVYNRPSPMRPYYYINNVNLDNLLPTNIIAGGSLTLNTKGTDTGFSQTVKNTSKDDRDVSFSSTKSEMIESILIRGYESENLLLNIINGETILESVLSIFDPYFQLKILATESLLNGAMKDITSTFDTEIEKELEYKSEYLGKRDLSNILNLSKDTVSKQVRLIWWDPSLGQSPDTPVPTSIDLTIDPSKLRNPNDVALGNTYVYYSNKVYIINSDGASALFCTEAAESPLVSIIRARFEGQIPEYNGVIPYNFSVTAIRSGKIVTSLNDIVFLNHTIKEGDIVKFESDYIGDSLCTISVYKRNSLANTIKHYLLPYFNNTYTLVHVSLPRSILILHSTDRSLVEKDSGLRYGNASGIRCEIRYGRDSSVFKLVEVKIDYIKSPLFIRLTLEQIDLTEDYSQMMEFPDYVNQEIINELVHLVMERSADPRLSTNILMTQSIARPTGQLQQT